MTWAARWRSALAVLLTLVCLGSTPGTAWAHDATDHTDTSFAYWRQDAITKLPTAAPQSFTFGYWHNGGSLTLTAKRKCLTSSGMLRDLADVTVYTSGGGSTYTAETSCDAGEKAALWRLVAGDGTLHLQWRSVPHPVAAPVASFTADPLTGTAPLAVTLSDTSSGSPTAWAWDLGDGRSLTGAGPHSVSYSTAGTFVVTLTATNDGGSSTASQTITVSEATTTTSPASTSSTACGATRDAPCYVTSIDPPPAGYLLDAEQFSAVAGGLVLLLVTTSGIFAAQLRRP